MDKYTLTLTNDSYDCELCGWSSAQGFRLEDGDGKAVLESEAIAHCYAGQDVDTHDVMMQSLKFFGEKHGFSVELADERTW